MNEQRYHGNRDKLNNYSRDSPSIRTGTNRFSNVLNAYKKPSGNPTDKEEDWKKLRDRIQRSLIFGDPEVWMYASYISSQKIGFLEAVDIAAERLGKLRKEVNKKYPIDNPELTEAREKEYYTKLLKLISKA